MNSYFVLNSLIEQSLILSFKIVIRIGMKQLNPSAESTKRKSLSIFDWSLLVNHFSINNQYLELLGDQCQDLTTMPNNGHGTVIVLIINYLEEPTHLGIYRSLSHPPPLLSKKHLAFSACTHITKNRCVHE